MFTGNYVCTSFTTGMPSGLFNLATGTSDVYKIALYTSSATLLDTTTAYTATGEVTDAGYTAGGSTLTISTPPTIGATGAVTYLSFSNVSWSGIITARGALIYQSGGSNRAVCVLDFGSNKTSAATFTVQFPSATNTTAIIRIS